MIIENKFKIVKKVEHNIFRKFLLKLGNTTQYNFNHFGKINFNNINRIVQQELTRKDKVKFFALVENELIGYGFLTKFEKFTKKHNCILGIVISDSWQNSGLGKKLCTYMILDAWKNGFKKIWLNVYYDNERAFHLYKSLGFDIEGIFMADEIINKKQRHV